MKDILSILLFIFCFFPSPLFGAVMKEIVFADYFDIPVNSPSGTEVMGRIHLERNKDVCFRPIPKGYRFEIVEQDEKGLFALETRYDLSRRIMGVLTVKEGCKTGSIPDISRLTIALKDSGKLVQKFDIKVYIVKQTLWSKFNERYTPTVINNQRLYGKQKFTDEQVTDYLDELETNDWRFKGEKCYTARPQDYPGQLSKLDHWKGGTIEYDWMNVANRIGGLGYAYATSKVYGPEGKPKKHARLRNALYQSILAYTRSVPVDGSDIEIDGKSIGKYVGDGFSLLQKYKLAGHQILTHQWVMTDPLVVPVLHLMPDLLKGMEQGDATCLQVHDALIRYFQIATSIVENRRAIDNPKERWGEIQDTLYSSGAWSDANLGHRSRTMLALPIIWADYNRPMTYVQYWYKDYYGGKPFKDFSFSPGWSPKGVANDVAYWMTKNCIVAHRYAQSGFQPDGTISHHTDRGTDIAMVAYGFEWLTDCNTGYQYFKNTPYEVDGKYMQFQLDYLLRVYPKLFYKQEMDFLVAGRSFDSDQRKFVKSTYVKAVNSLFKSISKRSNVKGTDELKSIVKRLKTNTYEYSGTDAYWVNEFLVHRRGEHESPFYASLKLKSERTVGAEDFDKKVRRSWHMGYGILPLKVKGNEYSAEVLKGFDWHALPGLTEEWRTDLLPLKGGSQASLPGLNKISGVLADGIAGMGIYHHLPKEKYSSAIAFKSYHFIGNKIISQGSGIARYREGQGSGISTFIDQSALTGPLTWCINGEIREITPEESVAISESIEDVCWLHQGRKGYVILPQKKLQLLIKTGKEINITDRRKSVKVPGFIIAVDHGANPGEKWDNSYRYILLPNVDKEEMSERVRELQEELEFIRQDASVHGVYSAKDKVWQYAFFQPDSTSVGGVEVASEDVAQIMLREETGHWILSVGNPMPDGKKQVMSFRLSVRLPQGIYTYRVGGIYPHEGETVSVVDDGKGSKVIVELPDIRDAARYNYQSDLYASVPIVIDLPKENPYGF